MPDIRQTFSADGTVVEQWDDATRVYTDFSTDPDTTRPYTAAENSRADATAATATAAANKATIEQALGPALDEIQTILDATNATINAGPAPFIKILARALRRVIRLLTRRFDGTA